ncbi:hypothetical protein KPL70_001110 [Citrus sinensis]|nr:hypothetical protein KPL70_001110 [Citrus sinensis]
MVDGVVIMRRSCCGPKEVWKMSFSGGVVLQGQAYVQDCRSLTGVVASFSTMGWGKTIQVMSRHQMYHNTSSVVSLDGSRVKPIRNKFSRWKEENGKGSVTRCFICKKKGHYAKDCPNKREKSIRLVEHLQATTNYSPEKDELEFYFSKQDEPNDETMFALQNSSDDSDSDQSQVIFHQQILSLDTSIPIPSIKLQILPSKFQRPVPAIGLIDTGAQRSMLNPHILPPKYWTEYKEHFKAVNGKLFTTSLITKNPIDLALLIPPIRLKTLSNIPISLNQPKSVSPPTLLLALISCTNDLAPLPVASAPSSLPDALTLKNISSLPAWISVLFKPPLLSNMSLWRFPPSCSPTENEKFHNNTAPIQTSESMFERRQDGTVRMTFKPPPSAQQEPPRLSFTDSSMITTVQTAQEDLPITRFNSEGYPVYLAKQNGHFLWDAPGSGMYPPPPPAPLPFYRKKLKWIAKHCKSETPSPIPLPTPPLTCMMFSSTSSDYSSSFPPLDTHTDSQRNVVSKPFVPSPITSSGHLEPSKPFESVLNWQTQNVRAQNDTLLNINSKVEHISLRIEQLETKVDSISAQMQQIHHNLQSRITQLDSELRAMLAQRYYGPEFDQKEREIRRLQAEPSQIESEKQRPTLFTTSPPIPSIGPPYHPFASMLSPIRQYDPSKLFGMTHTLFRDNPLPPPPKPKPKPKPQPRPVILHLFSISIPGQHSPGHTLASPPVPPPPTESQPPSQSKDKQPMHQFSAHAVDYSPTTDDQTSDSNLAVSNSHTETDTEFSVSTSDSEKSYADITRILMAQPDQPTLGQTSHTESYVDIPSEVEEEMPESSTTNQPPPAQPQTSPPSQNSSNGPWPGATTQSVLRAFATRFTGALRDWFDSLGRYRQLQFVDLPEVSSALAVLHDQFLGDPSAVFEAARRDYLNMKCCSLNAKDLDFHYKRMSLLFYKLNGFNEPTLKHVFLASLPDELQPDIQRQLTASNLSLDNISLGKIFQLAKTCLDKLCEQK